MAESLKNISLENLKNLYNNNMTKTRERNAAYLISLRRRAKGEATAKINKIITLYNQSKNITSSNRREYNNKVNQRKNR